MRGLCVGEDMVILFFSDPAVFATTHLIQENIVFYSNFLRKFSKNLLVKFLKVELEKQHGLQPSSSSTPRVKTSSGLKFPKRNGFIFREKYRTIF